MKRWKRYLILNTLFLMLLSITFSACAQSDLQFEPAQFFDDIFSALANGWDTVVQFFENLGSSIEESFNGILSGLSGIGEGMTNMFQGFFNR